MQDGICENCTAAMLQPYRNAPTDADPRGMSFIDPEELDEVCGLLARHGFHIHMHAVGDRAVRECLDALTAANAERPGLHHQIAHLDNGVPGRGAGGHCFLKDFAALRFHYEEKFPDHSHMHTLLRSFEATNNYLLRSTGKDKELLEGVYGKDVLCVCKVNDKGAVCVCEMSKAS